MSDKHKRATIVDVAKLAGVSIGTVSRIVNTEAGPEATRKRVLAAIAELDYVPNHVARSLKRRTTEQIALVVPDLANPVYVAMAKSIQREAKERGYRLSLMSTDDAPGEEDFALDGLEQRRVDGIIICSLKPTARLVERLERVHERVCVVGRVPEAAHVDNVRVDSTGGALAAVQHLLDSGRRTVGFINGTAGTVPAETRAAGYRRALEENGLQVDEDLCASDDFSMAGGYRSIDSLLATRRNLDAIFCANDVIALGALRRLRELGIDVPGQVALVGMDDIELGKISTPTLSTVSLLAEERGRLAAEMLLDRLLGGDGEPPRKVTVAPRLIVRESSTDYIRHEVPT
ncbi:MAG TPA: LacI family DNA-binding transcriptional regulator [Trueperaceae bacterium]|nr:LacI family DNA-binding transcriptional regulator [Trueperaceae bacterium]